MRSTAVCPVVPVRRFRCAGLVSALTLLLAVPAGTQGPPSGDRPSDPSEQGLPTFRASVRYVEVDVDVKVGGRFLAGLTRDDFELFEDRQPQVIDRVTVVDIPAITDSAGDEPPVIPSGANAEPLPPLRLDGFNESGRIYAMVLGIAAPSPGGGATSSGPHGADGVKHLARKFIHEYLAPGDLLAVVHATTPARGQGLTSDKERLLAAVDRYGGGASPDGGNGPPTGSDRDLYLFSSPYRPPTYQEGRLDGVYRTVKEVAVSLGSITGRRKSIILIGVGEDLWAERWDIHDRWASVRDATRTASAFNVPIHTIKPDGMLVPLIVDGGSSGPLPSGFAPDSGPETGRRLLSQDTNGLDLGTVNSADRGFSRVVAQNTSYYILGYYSSLEPDGRNHPITVRVKHKDATVNARRGVRMLRPIQMPRAVNLPRAMPERARGALLGEEEVATLPIETSVHVFHGADFRAALLVHAAVDGSTLDVSAGRRLEFSAAAVDAQGTIRAFDRRAFTLDVRDDTRTRLGRDPLTFFTRMELPPGQYTIRVSAHQPEGPLGFQSREVLVPDFAERALNISEVVVASASRPSVILQPDEAIRRALQGAPTLERRFSTSETLAVFAEVFDTHWPLASELTATWAIARGETIVMRGEQTVEVERGGRGYFRGTIESRALGPGDYVLQVEVGSNVGAPVTARSSMPFQIFSDAP